MEKALPHSGDTYMHTYSNAIKIVQMYDAKESMAVFERIGGGAGRSIHMIILFRNDDGGSALDHKLNSNRVKFDLVFKPLWNHEQWVLCDVHIEFAWNFWKQDRRI